jgi:hypothetical protein
MMLGLRGCAVQQPVGDVDHLVQQRGFQAKQVRQNL